ncbi:hypothetical protein EDB81DRAFT_208557 [Dactylonectria macrodidyma]|uniref:Uncharacterized protein n=1 Tax=Dactylonectria macrodidyma TaxID=307937 RepID=A0A9P9IL86_9HYPO|nr:hypothetical protein EDB81DRAFT_208557 [Dactylonectria macrodidyma]
MGQFSVQSRGAAARAARAYLAGDYVTRTTRRNPSPSRKMTITEIAALHHAETPLTKKYISLIRAGKPLPSDSKGGQPRALTASEERALI